MKIIETKNLCYSYDDGKRALDNVSVSFERGKITAVLGANGAGKSTLFLNLNGILKPSSGEIYFKGQLVKYDKKSIREMRKNVGIVFQDPDDQLFSASVEKDISFGAVNLGLLEDEVRRRVNEAMEKTGVTELKEKPVHALSFGQKKRVAIAGVLVMEPEIIILDEPTAGLDPRGVSELMRLLEKLCAEGATIVMATHDIDTAAVYMDYAYVLDGGKIIAEGAKSEIFSNPEMLRSHNLRLPRISHLLEVLNKADGIEADFSKSTVSEARRELLRLMR